MPFQIAALSPEPFRRLFGLSDDALSAEGVIRSVAASGPGVPCRVSLEDAQAGDRLLLLNYEHQPAATPYRSAHAIFVREGAEQAHPAPGELPEALRRRLLSLRAFDARGMLRDADVVEGRGAALTIEAMLASDPFVASVHIHNARWGCYIARADRA